MAERAKLNRPIAVLIDAENVSASKMPYIWKKVGKLGVAGVRRAYGNINSMNGWKEEIESSLIQPRLQIMPKGTKNTTDFALVIDAMDILYSDRCGGICIISSDGDFSLLAARIQEFGLPVFGFGESKTPMHYRKICTEFYVLPIAPPKDVNENPSEKENISESEFPINSMIGDISQVVSEVGGKSKKIALTELGKLLRQKIPDFASNRMGHASLGKLLAKHIGLFECFDKNGDPTSIGVHFVKLK
tara:strand:- start:3939 stop:4676 length:738 start_codon:yes stop_codon:yes gene_type:complete